MELEEYKDWKEHPITKHLTQILTETRDDMIESLGNGHTVGENTGEQTSLLVGKIAGLNYFINHHHEDME